MKQFKQMFASGDVNKIAETDKGMIWLKLKSVSRKEYLNRIKDEMNFAVKSTTADCMFTEIYDLLSGGDKQTLLKFDAILREISNNMVEKTGDQLDDIIDNLYQVQSYHWGGGWRNALDKFLIKQYVKTNRILPHDELLGACCGAIQNVTQNYLVNSWYNYWSSVLIEHIFNQHDKVLSAPGKIKNIDFFIDDYPFDLKVTYLPQEFYNTCYKTEYGNNEQTVLKKLARAYHIQCGGSTGQDLSYALESQLEDKAKVCCDAKRELQTYKSNRTFLIEKIVNDKKRLIKWLYENQGEMRFGSENRIFVILVDKNDIRQAWKLKRNKDVLEPNITKYLDAFDKSKLSEIAISFSYKNQNYQVYSDIIFVKSDL